MQILIDWLRAVLGRHWIWGLPLIVLLGLGFQQYRSEQSYHRWAGSFVAHQHSDVKYEDGYVRVYWEKLPKAPKTDIVIHYLFYRPGLPLVGNVQQYIPVDESNVYRDGKMQDEHNLHLVPYWGSPIFVGDLEPGTYELVVHYEYPASWWYPNWNADQRITFKVEDDNA